MTSAAPSNEVFVFPLSFAQQRLWFLHEIDPSSAAYNMPLAFRLSGQLKVEALQWALDEIVRRHEVLRTTFDVLDENPVQLIAAAGELALVITDLSSLPPSLAEAEAERLMSEEAQRPFDLKHGPLIRAMLMRLGTDEHVLLVTMHHIISDGWSQTILMNELGALYEAAVAGRDSPLPELPIQYADFAEWQRKWLQGEMLDQQLDYWRKHLTGAPPSLQLPADRPRPAVQTFNGARHAFSLSRDLSARLMELSRREDTTLFMTLLAAFYVLLHRYTGETDIVVGTPVANRNRQELESLIGFFVNTLALRANLSGDPAFRELLAQVRNVSLEAYAHQDLPFDMLVEELSPIRDWSRNPLFQVMFALQNMPEAASQSLGLTISPVDVKTTQAQFDLILDAIEFDGQLHLTFVYNTDLFDSSTIELIATHFKVLLAGVLADPGHSIGTLPLLTAKEQIYFLDQHLNPAARLYKPGERSQTAIPPERADERVGPRDALEAQLAHIWEELLHVKPGVRDDFFELGGHSLLLLSLLARVERITGKKLRVASVLSAPTIESLAMLLRHEVDSPASPLVAMQPRGSLPPLFFVHPAGGSVAAYFALARALGTERPFYALEGVQRESEGRALEQIAASYVEVIRTVQPDGPYLLGGWSTGGVVAFEMARQLQASGADVAPIVLLDSVAPGDDDGDLNDDVSILAGFAVNLGVPLDLIPAASDDILQSGTEAQLEWMLDQARRAGALPPAVDLDDLRRRFKVYLADVDAVRNYRPSPASMPLVLLRASDEPEDLETIARWRRLSANKLEIHNVPGDHLTMMRAPHVATIAKVLYELTKN
jgi:syringomycin synthetase protein SyrE